MQIDTDEHKRWIKRNGAERVDGQPSHLTLIIGRDDRNASGKMAHNFPEKIFFDGHRVLSLLHFHVTSQGFVGIFFEASTIPLNVVL
jgi:hypothetical protein